MKFAALHRAVFVLLMTILVGVPGYAKAPPLRVLFVNSSGYANTDVYIGFIGATLDATNASTGAKLALSAWQSAHWYTLDKLPSGLDLYSFVGGRIYVGYGTPWVFLNSGYEPPPDNPSDPNYHKRFDKLELTYTPAPADVADTTSIDYFSIPLELRVYDGGTSGKLVGSVTASVADKIVTALSAVTTPAGKAVVKTAGGNFVRVIGPGQYAPPSPYNNFNAYLGYLRNTYAPAHSNIFARIKGHFAGVGANPTTPETKPQNYDFAATISAALDITLKGSGSVVGAHTLLLKHADLIAPTGIYGANPPFSLDGGTATTPLNNIYGWLIGDLLAGLNIGAIGSDVAHGNTTIGQMNSQAWFALTPPFFATFQPANKDYYNRWAATLSPISQAYNFAYSDRFAHAHVVVPLYPGAPEHVDTMEIEFVADHAATRGCVPGPFSWMTRSCGGKVWH
jgi:hypothetical protein